MGGIDLYVAVNPDKRLTSMQTVASADAEKPKCSRPNETETAKRGGAIDPHNAKGDCGTRVRTDQRMSTVSAFQFSRR